MTEERRKTKNRVLHGTRADALPEIAQHGLGPRGERISNWKKAPSRADRVYLTGPYGLYFAAASLRNGDPRGSILSIDSTQLEPELLCADEDVFVQLAQSKGVVDRETMYDYAANGDFSEYEWAWDFSLARLGNCAYRGIIPASAIEQVALVTFNADLCHIALDPTITITNTMLTGAFYVRLMDWVFTGAHPWNDMHGESADPSTFNAERVQAYEQLRRDCIRVCTLNEAVGIVSTTQGV